MTQLSFFLLMAVLQPKQIPILTAPPVTAPAPPQTPTNPQPQQPPSQQPQNPQTQGQALGSTLQASAAYKFGAGDSFLVIAWNGVETTQQAITIASDGTALIPFSINKLLKIEGMTQLEVRDLIRNEMQKYYLNPEVQVLATSIQSKKALMVGDVTSGRAGYFPITGDETVMEFVTQNGGYSGSANLANIQVTHEGGQRVLVNLYDTLLKDDKSGYTKMQPNDIVYIPSVQNVSNKTFVIAEGKSGVILQDSNKITLMEALSKGNAFGTGSRIEDVYVIRVNPKDLKTPIQFHVKFTDFYKKANLSVNMTLENGDIVYVPKSRTLKVNDLINAVTPLLGFIQTTILFDQVFKTQ